MKCLLWARPATASMPLMRCGFSKCRTRSPPVVKSRTCGRGWTYRRKESTGIRQRHQRYHIGLPWRWELNTCGTEAFDVSTAFLQGLRFQENEARAKELGHECKKIRKVWLQPPANVWRHLPLLIFATVEDIERFFFPGKGSGPGFSFSW
eukprot:1608135-Pyramimonas_sp.AAC.1